MQRLISIRFFNTITLFFSFSILVAQDPPSNDTYKTATLLNVQTGSCADKDKMEGTLKDATDTNIGDITKDCTDFSDGYTDYEDVWYKAAVPDSGMLTIETSANMNNQLDTAIVAYSLSGDSLTAISCDDNGGELINTENTDGVRFSKLELTNQKTVDTIYLKVVDAQAVFGTATVEGKFLFKICAYEPSSLETPQTHKPLLSYYSNPVGNHLVVESPYEIQSLSVYDLRGKAVLHKTPNQQKLRLQTYMLAAGAYVLRVETPEGQQTVQLLKK